jgi:hypothetical protein
LLQSDTLAGETAINTGADTWTWSVGTCSVAFTITCTAGVYHLSGPGNEIDGSMMTCDPFGVTFGSVDLTCNGEGIKDIHFHCDAAPLLSFTVAGLSNAACDQCVSINGGGYALTRDAPCACDLSCSWTGTSMDPCTFNSHSIHWDGVQWVFTIGDAVYTCAAGAFNCAGTSVFHYSSDGGNCLGWPATINVSA